MKKRIVWSLEMIQQEANKYSSRAAFSDGSRNAYAAAQRKKILDLVCAHMDPPQKAWSISEVKMIAEKHQTRGEFAAKNHNAYMFAHRNNMLESVCGHMPRPKRWTDEEILLEAKKYETRAGFQRGNIGAYTCASRRNLMDAACQHMRFAGASRLDAVYIWMVANKTVNGMAVYKIGATSSDIGDWRIKRVAKAAGFEYKTIELKKVADAKTLEKLLLELGVEAKVTNTDGKTEFRSMSDEEVQTAVDLINMEAA